MQSFGGARSNRASQIITTRCARSRGSKSGSGPGTWIRSHGLHGEHRRVGHEDLRVVVVDVGGEVEMYVGESGLWWRVRGSMPAGTSRARGAQPGLPPGRDGGHVGHGTHLGVRPDRCAWGSSCGPQTRLAGSGATRKPTDGGTERHRWDRQIWRAHIDRFPGTCWTSRSRSGLTPGGGREGLSPGR